MKIFRAFSNISHSSPSTKWHWGWATTLALVALATLAFRYALPIRDGDIWWHMLYGKYFLEHKTLVADHTIFSWAPAANNIIYCTWLPDIFLYLLFSTGGLFSLFLFRYLCIFSFFFVVLLFAKKHRLALHPITWLICLVGILMSYTGINVKPEIVSFVLITLMAWNWWHIRSNIGNEKDWWHCYFFPMIMLIWVNSHGGFIFGLLFLTCAAIGELLNTVFLPRQSLPRKTRLHLQIATIGSFFSVLLNPYGWRYLKQTFFFIVPTKENIDFISTIAAYAAPFNYSGVSVGFATLANLALAILLLLFIANFKTKKAEWSTLLANIVFAFLYTRYLRTTFFWAPVFSFSALHLLSHRPPFFFPLKKNMMVAQGIIISAFCFFLSFFSIYDSKYKPERYQWLGFGISEGNPVNEAKFIKNNLSQYRIGNTYDQGAFLLWTLWPGNKIMIDSRHFPYRNWANEYFNFQSGKNVQQFVEQYQSDVWCVGLVFTKAWKWFVKSPDWNLAYYDKNAAVFVKNGISASGKIISGHGLESIKTPFLALKAFTFSIAIKDWEGTEKIIRGMERNVNTSRREDMVVSTKKYYEATLVYQRFEYDKVIKLLQEINPGIIKNDSMHVISLLHVAEQAWSDGLDLKALTLLNKSLKIFPVNPYAEYNLGVMKWYYDQAENVKTGDDRIGKDTSTWRKHLVSFLNNSHLVKDSAKYKKIANLIIKGNYHQRPDFIHPPEPTPYVSRIQKK